MQRLSSEKNFIQLIGGPGSGARRLAFKFIQPASRVVWISQDWNLYGPSLWSLAHECGNQLLGIEYKNKKQFRALCKTLAEVKLFDAWILDALKLSEAEGKFLQLLLRHLSLPHKVLVIDTQVHSFCTKRAHLKLSHDQFKMTWSKGGDLNPQFLPSPLQEWWQKDRGAVCTP